MTSVVDLEELNSLGIQLILFSMPEVDQQESTMTIFRLIQPEGFLSKKFFLNKILFKGLLQFKIHLIWPIIQMK